MLKLVWNAKARKERRVFIVCKDSDLIIQFQIMLSALWSFSSFFNFFPSSFSLEQYVF